MDDWHEEEVLITVRAYPEPSSKYTETSCVAGITGKGEPRRLYPVPDRLLEDESRFSRYDIIRARTRKASTDGRPESFRVDFDSGLPKIGHLETKDDWAERDRWVAPFRAPSMEALHFADKALVRSRPSLGLIRPSEILGLDIVRRDKDDWTEAERAKLGKDDMFLPKPKRPLEFIPYRFYYRFRCSDDRCKGNHKMHVVDWEMSQAYRRWSLDYGEKWEEKFREKFEHWMGTRDLQFYVGTMNNYPMTWIIIGLYYPPKRSHDQSKVPNRQPSLFT